MYVEIVEEFQPLESKKNTFNKNQKLPTLTTPNMAYLSSLNKSPISTSSKGALSASEIVNQKSILKQKKIKQQYDDIYNNTILSKRLSKTSYKKLNCIYGEEEEREIIIKRKKTDLSSLYSRIEKKKYPIQFKLSHISTAIAKEIENRNDKLIKLSSDELKQMKNIYRKGVTMDRFTNSSYDNSRKDEVFDLFKKKKPVKNFIYKKEGLDSRVYDVIEKDFKPVLDLACRQIKLSQEAMERELQLEFAKDFKIVEPYNFAKEFRTCEEIIEFEKKEEIKREYFKNNKRHSLKCDILDTLDRGHIVNFRKETWLA
jgi:hypothetical protein